MNSFLKLKVQKHPAVQLLNYTEPHQIYACSGEVILLVIHMTKGGDKNSYLIQKSGNAIPCYTLSPNPHSSSSLSHCWTSPAPPRALLEIFLSPCHASSHCHQLLPVLPFPRPPPNADRNFAATPCLTVTPLRNPRKKVELSSRRANISAKTSSPGVMMPKTQVSRSSLHLSHKLLGQTKISTYLLHNTNPAPWPGSSIFLCVGTSFCWVL